MMWRRRLFFLSFTLLLGSSACHAILGLDEPVVADAGPDADAGDERAPAEGDGSAEADVGPVGDGSNDVAVVDAGCWADVVLVDNTWEDLLNTPVPQPATATGVSNRASYDASVPGEVYDNVTKLTWLLEPDGGTSPSGTRADAIAACASRGARLPTRMELITIQNWYPVDDATAGADQAVFPDTVEAYYWSTTPTSSNVKWGWGVAFYTGGAGTNLGFDTAASLLRYRCVRGPAPSRPTHRYEISQACNIVRDNGTRLEWERGRGKSGKYIQAEAYCQSLPPAGRNEWRIPTYSELSSLLYTKRENPAIDTLAFETEQGNYWTSTLPNRAPNHRVVVPFSTGSTTDIRNDDVPDLWARCVRTMD